MNLVVRRIIYLSFFVIFLLAAAGLLFYLQGFRYNPVKHKIERTGAIMVDSEPSAAKIFLNNNLYRYKTPQTISSLAPQNYDVRVEKDGWQNWHKQLPVKQSLVTFTGKIRLWPVAPANELLTLGKIKLIELSPNRENLLYTIASGLNAGLWLLNLTAGKSSLLDRPSATDFAYLEWSPSSRQFLAAVNKNGLLSWQVFDLTQKSWQKLNLPLRINITAIHWGDNDEEIYFASDDEIYLINRETGASKLLWRERLKEFRIHDGLIFGLAVSRGGSIIIKLLNLSNLQTILLDQPPGLSSNLEFLPAGEKWLPLFDRDRHSLYLLHSPLTNLKPLRRLPEVTALDWSKDYNHVLLTNNIENWDYDVKQDKLDFILRLSTPLGRARYYNNEPYLIITIGQEIWAMELDLRDVQQRWLLASYNQTIEDVFLDPSGKTLIVKTADKLYRLNLTAP